MSDADDPSSFSGRRCDFHNGPLCFNDLAAEAESSKPGGLDLELRLFAGAMEGQLRAPNSGFLKNH